jgi:hypothetical protein
MFRQVHVRRILKSLLFREGATLVSALHYRILILEKFMRFALIAGSLILSTSFTSAYAGSLQALVSPSQAPSTCKSEEIGVEGYEQKLPRLDGALTLSKEGPPVEDIGGELIETIEIGCGQERPLLSVSTSL